MDAIMGRLTASELAIGDLRQTMTAQAQNADSVRALLDQLSSNVAQVNRSHEAIHQELNRIACIEEWWRERAQIGSLT